MATRNYPEDVLAMSADEFDKLVGGSDDEEEAFEMYDNGRDAEWVAEQLGIDVDDALLLYRDWQGRDDGPEPQEEEPIDCNMPDTWAMGGN